MHANGHRCYAHQSADRPRPSGRAWTCYFFHNTMNTAPNATPTPIVAPTIRPTAAPVCLSPPFAPLPSVAIATFVLAAVALAVALAVAVTSTFSSSPLFSTVSPLAVLTIKSAASSLYSLK
jgi:hypothetical protein